MKEFAVVVLLETRALAVHGELRVAYLHDKHWTKVRAALEAAGFRVSESVESVDVTPGAPPAGATP